ncbi:hypothetical protein BURK2_03224 [Burkholderiales bacterium]|nr:MAG: hypothetical protein F9K47_06345 [Burkholderiales bacterium]CAG1003554.1 hypothetical protein BURK2_03224 [Burkholderiales bacterium]
MIWRVLVVLSLIVGLGPRNCLADGSADERAYRAAFVEYRKLDIEVFISSIPRLQNAKQTEKAAALERIVAEFAECHMKALDELPQELRNVPILAVKAGATFLEANRALDLAVLKEVTESPETKERVRLMIQKQRKVVAECVEQAPAVGEMIRHLPRPDRIEETDAKIAEYFVGSWVVQRSGEPVFNTTTYRNDGTTEYVSYRDARCDQAVFTSTGKWKIDGGMLVIEITASSDANHRIKPGLIILDEVLSIDSSRMVLKSIKGVKGTRRKASGCASIQD